VGGGVTDWRVVEADCVEAMRELDADSIDAVVTDPPYLIEFMGRSWDSAGGGHEMQAWHEAWAVEALRVLKPGGHLLAFGGTRTYHRLACALEDAGFEIRDCLIWMYGSGFPKSHDVAKAVDRHQGVDVQADERWRPTPHFATGAMRTSSGDSWLGQATGGERVLYEPSTAEAERWQGWGTALKPAWEPIVMARRPVSGTVAANVLEHGTGGMNIDGCRVAFASDADYHAAADSNQHADKGNGPRKNTVLGQDTKPRPNYSAPGRWPANVLLAHADDCVRVGTARIDSNGHHPAARAASDAYGGGTFPGQVGLEERSGRGEQVERWACVPGCPVRALDEQTKDLAKAWSSPASAGYEASSYYIPKPEGYQPNQFGDQGGASRFFYTAKASGTERNAGLGDLPERDVHRYGAGVGAEGRGESGGALDRNHHPTVKPVDLMRWLVRLVTPRGGTVLDPFCGSGTTGIAARLERFAFVGVERDADYADIARRRIAYWDTHRDDALERVRRVERGERDREARREAGQLDLFGAA
jgi:DNA modification methylase